MQKIGCKFYHFFDHMSADCVIKQSPVKRGNAREQLHDRLRGLDKAQRELHAGEKGTRFLQQCEQVTRGMFFLCEDIHTSESGAESPPSDSRMGCSRGMNA
jgi:hypothetical protein